MDFSLSMSLLWSENSVIKGRGPSSPKIQYPGVSILRAGSLYNLLY